jgi:hypothetical protein
VQDLFEQLAAVTERGVLLGVRGWSWSEWEGAFYPEDMPPEWRLTFYNTQFDCVFLPSAQWQGAASEQFELWQEDTHDQFLFLLEGEGSMPVPTPLRSKAICIPAQDSRIVWFDRHTDLRRLAETLKQGRDAPAFLLSRDGDLAQLQRVRTLLELLGPLA